MRFATFGRRSGELFRRSRMRVATLGRLLLAKLRRAFSYSLTCHGYHSEVSNGRVAARSFVRCIHGDAAVSDGLRAMTHRGVKANAVFFFTR